MAARHFSQSVSSLARIAFVVPLLWVPALAQQAPSSGTTSFVFDGNRMYAELAFVRPDGSVHRALAFVDLGSPSMMVPNLFSRSCNSIENRCWNFVSATSRFAWTPARLPAIPTNLIRSVPISK